jgi:hypothetical protein
VLLPSALAVASEIGAHILPTKGNMRDVVIAAHGNCIPDFDIFPSQDQPPFILNHSYSLIFAFKFFLEPRQTARSRSRIAQPEPFAARSTADRKG